MSQQGQVFAQRSAGADGAPPWGYRYRLGGRDATRVQTGGYRSEQDAREALERALERVRRSNGIGRSPTLAELVGEYLAWHDAQPEGRYDRCWPGPSPGG